MTLCHCPAVPTLPLIKPLGMTGMTVHPPLYQHFLDIEYEPDEPDPPTTKGD